MLKENNTNIRSFDKGRSKVIVRQRLLDLLHDTEAQTVFISAGPGYGKSSLLTTFADNVSEPVVFYRLEKLDRDLAWFADRLLQSIRYEWPGFQSEEDSPVRVALRTGKGEASAELYGDGFVQAFAAEQRPLTLIFDDYHEIEHSSRTLAFFNYLLGHPVDGVRYIIASRNAPGQSLSRQRAYRMLLEIGNDELAFTLEESRKLLGRHGLDTNDDAVRVLHDKTMGWAAGLVMAAHAIGPSQSEGNLDKIRELGGSIRYTYDFLAQEVLMREAPAVQYFLLRTGILELLRPDVCDGLVGTRSARSILEDLEHRGLFVFRRDVQSGEYGYHPLFQQFLRDKLVETIGLSDVQRLHLLAAEVSESHGHLSDAVSHYCAGGMPVRAADLVEAIGPHHLEAGFFEIVHQWIQALPREILRTRPSILLLHGKILHQQGELEEALGALERAYLLFGSAKDHHGRTLAASELGLLHTRRGTNDQAVGILKEVLESDTDPILQADAMRALSANLRELGQVDDAIKHVERAYSIARAQRSSSRQANTLLRVTRSLALSYLIAGRLKAATDALEEVIRGNIWTNENGVELSWAWCNLGTAHSFDGNFDQALDAWTKAEALTGSRIQVQKQWVSLWRGCLLRDRHEFERADEELRSVGDRGLAEVAMLRLLQGQMDDALQIARFSYRSGMAETAIDRAKAEGMLGIALAYNGIDEAADRHLSTAEEVLEKTGGRFRLLSLRLHRAAILLDRGRTREAETILRKALRFAASNNYRHFLWWHPQTIARLCAHAISNNIESDYAMRLASLRLGPEEMAHFGDIANEHGAARRNVISVAQDLGELGDLVEATSLEVLSGCSNESTRKQIAGALQAKVLTLDGLQKLRNVYDLTWRELHIFIVYYLLPLARPDINSGSTRKECAESLWLSENTIRVHVKNIRRKLDLPWETGSVHLREWLVQRGLIAK